MSLEFALTENFVWWYCGTIVVFALFFAGGLAWHAFPLHRRLRNVNEELKDIHGEKGFADAFEKYNSHVEQAFGLPWKEFVETLVLPEPQSGDSIRNTGEVSRYLNDTTVIFPRISSGFYQAVPNLLTGMGILGTFLGLAGGVGSASSGLSSSDPGEITAALQKLLGGASLAFWTSIVGIVCSILFVFFERITSRRLHVALDKWVGAIECRLERVTPEGVALQQLEQARRTTTQLERFNSELIFSLEKALDEKIAGRLSPQLEQLLGAVEGLRADRSTDSGRMINKALERFTAAMQERAGSQFEEMASIVADLNRTLKESADGLSQTQRDVRDALDSVLNAVRTAMDTGTTAMNETLKQSLGEVTSVLTTASQQMANRLTDSGTEAASQITGSLQELQKAAGSLERASTQNMEMLSSMDQFVEKLNAMRGTIESTHQEIVKVTEPVGSAALDIRESSDRTTKALASTNDLVGRVETSVNTLERHQQEVATAWTEYQSRFEGIDSSLAEVFRQIDEGLSRYCAQVKEFANELDKTTSNTVQQLASATAELSGAIEDLIPRLPESR